MIIQNLPQSSVIDKIQQNIIKIIKIPLKYTKYSHKIPKTYLFSAFPRIPPPQKNAKLGHQIEFTKKHCMFSENFIQALDNFHEPGLRGLRRMKSADWLIV